MSHISSSIQTGITILNLYQFFFLLFVLLFELTFHSECNEERKAKHDKYFGCLLNIKKLNDKKLRLRSVYNKKKK